MRGKDQRVWPTRKVAPHGYTPHTVAELLGWSVTRLMEHVARGQLPPPDVFRGRYVFPYSYVLDVKANGVRLPKTFTGLPPGAALVNPDGTAVAPRNRLTKRHKGKGVKKGAAKREGGAK